VCGSHWVGPERSRSCQGAAYAVELLNKPKIKVALSVWLLGRNLVRNFLEPWRSRGTLRRGDSVEVACAHYEGVNSAQNSARPIRSFYRCRALATPGHTL